MKSKKYIKHIIFILMVSFLIIFALNTFVSADFNPNEYNITAGNTEILNTKYADVINILKNVGTYASIIALILVGIKYMISSVEEKAEYKEKMTPYIIGATFVFAISQIIGVIQEITKDLSGTGNTVDTIGGKVITILSVLGSFLSVIMLVVLGIKYMGGSVEEKAEYKKSMIPYVIGAVLVFAASAIASVVYNLAIGL